jgi:hypothetical protein
MVRHNKRSLLTGFACIENLKDKEVPTDPSQGTVARNAGEYSPKTIGESLSLWML